MCICVPSQCSLLVQITEVEHVNAFIAVVAQVCSKMPYSVAQCFWINMWWLFFFSLRSIFSHLNNMSENARFWNQVITSMVPSSLCGYLKGRVNPQKSVVYTPNLNSFPPLFFSLLKIFLDYSRILDINNSFDVVCIFKKTFQLQIDVSVDCYASLLLLFSAGLYVWICILFWDVCLGEGRVMYLLSSSVYEENIRVQSCCIVRWFCCLS